MWEPRTVAVAAAVAGASSACDAGAKEWIQNVFGDCVYDTRDLVGFSLGLGSIFLWLVAQLPQLVTNYRLQRADALSPFFLAEWLLADTCNLLGALLKGDQPQTVVLTAQYFIAMDCVLLLQYLYYTSLERRRERTFVMAMQREQQRQHRPHHHHHHRHGSHAADAQGRMRSRAQAAGGEVAAEGGGGDFPEIVTVVGGVERGPSGGTAAAGGGRKVRAAAAMAAAGTLLLACGPHHPQGASAGAPLRRLLATQLVARTRPPPWVSATGAALGYVSCVLYLSSRASQIIKNHRRRSAEGLAPLMFVCAIAANLLYGGALLLRSRDDAELLSSLPWVLGSLGTVALDVTILAQGVAYGAAAAEKKNGSDEEEALLAPPPPWPQLPPPFAGPAAEGLPVAI